MTFLPPLLITFHNFLVLSGLFLFGGFFWGVSLGLFGVGVGVGVGLCWCWFFLGFLGGFVFFFWVFWQLGPIRRILSTLHLCSILTSVLCNYFPVGVCALSACLFGGAV